MTKVAQLSAGKAPRRGAPDQTILPGLARFTRVCFHCAAEFVTDVPDKDFCGEKCRAGFHNASSKVGRTLTPLAQAWRLGRNAKGNTAQAKALRASAARAFSEMCAILDQANADDLKVGRPNKLAYVRAKNARQGTLRREETVKFQEAQLAKAA